MSDVTHGAMVSQPIGHKSFPHIPLAPGLGKGISGVPVLYITSLQTLVPCKEPGVDIGISGRWDTPSGLIIKDFVLAFQYLG